VNASNIAADREWITELNRDGAAFLDLSEQTALVAIQGPRAAAILDRLSATPTGLLGRFRTVSADVAGVRCLIARTGYTGEDGFELFVAAGSGVRLFEALLEAGTGTGLKPCGLGARDTLRMEAGFPLYGHELDRATTPLEARLDSFVRFGRAFIGEAALEAERQRGLRKRLAGIQTEDARSVARQGYQLYRDNRAIGTITSGTFAPSFNRPLAMAYLTPDAGGWPREGDVLEVAIRDRRVPASIVPLPFYRRGARQAAAAPRPQPAKT
jgi:glycine cleavage system T protein (aminomethyltransferase)